MEGVECIEEEETQETTYYLRQNTEHICPAQHLLQRDRCEHQCDHQGVEHDRGQVQVAQDGGEAAGLDAAYVGGGAWAKEKSDFEQHN